MISLFYLKFGGNIGKLPPPVFCKSLFFTKARHCKSLLFTIDVKSLNHICLIIRPGVSLHPSLAALFSFLVSISVHFVLFRSNTLFCPKVRKKPGHRNYSIFHTVTAYCPNVSELLGQRNYFINKELNTRCPKIVRFYKVIHSHYVNRFVRILTKLF